jgi:hypothetical protein
VIGELALATALLMTLPLSAATTQETPMPPTTFLGTVTLDGHSVSDGTAVVALIDGKACGEAAGDTGRKGTWTAAEARPEYGIKTGDSLYAVDVFSDSQVPGCGTNGAVVTFLIAGRPAHQTGVWKAYPTPLNLTAETPHAGQTTATPVGGETPASPNSELKTSDDSSFPWWPAVAGVAGLVAVAIAAALWQARRTARRKQA